MTGIRTAARILERIAGRLLFDKQETDDCEYGYRYYSVSKKGFIGEGKTVHVNCVTLDPGKLTTNYSEEKDTSFKRAKLN